MDLYFVEHEYTDTIISQVTNCYDSDNRACMLLRVSCCGELLENVNDEFKYDYEIVFKAVLNYGLALKYACDRFKSDHIIIRAAVLENGLALQYAHAEITRDREIVLAAVTNNGGALEYAHDDLKCDPEIILAALIQKKSILDDIYQYVPEKFRQVINSYTENPDPIYNLKKMIEDTKCDKLPPAPEIISYDELKYVQTNIIETILQTNFGN